MNGWVKLHRSIIDWEWYNDPNMCHLFLHLILIANLKDGEWHGEKIKRGDAVVGYRSLSMTLGVSIRTLRTCLKRLKTTREVTLHVTHQFTIVTICKFESYQTDIIPCDTPNDILNDILNDKQVTRKRHANDTILIKEEDKSNIEINWRTDFSIYQKQCFDAFTKLANDSAFITDRNKFLPNVDIVKTMWNAYELYWSGDEAWKRFKKRKTVTINWTLVIKNAINWKSNKIYIPGSFNSKTEPVKSTIYEG